MLVVKLFISKLEIQTWKVGSRNRGERMKVAADPCIRKLEIQTKCVSCEGNENMEMPDNSCSRGIGQHRTRVLLCSLVIFKPAFLRLHFLSNSLLQH